jgi:hypothetical protein
LRSRHRAPCHRVAAEDPAQPCNVDIDGAVDRIRVVGPRERKAALAGEDDARPPRERLEQSELARLDRANLPFDGDGPP